jgi:hypothetical protein
LLYMAASCCIRQQVAVYGSKVLYMAASCYIHCTHQSLL